MIEPSSDEDLSRYGRYQRFQLSAPWWQLAVANGVFGGLFFGAFSALTGAGTNRVAGLPPAVFSGLFFGLIFGPFVAVLAVRQRRRTLTATGGSPEQVARSSRAAWRGPVPTDPEARRVAYELARHQLDLLRRRRMFMLGTFSFMTILGVWLALTGAPWLWLTAAIFAGFLGWTLWLPGRLRQRLELLRPDAG